MAKVKRLIITNGEVPVTDELFNKIKNFIETQSNGKLVLEEDHRHLKNGVPIKINYKIMYKEKL